MPRGLWVAFLILPATAAMYLGYTVWLGAVPGFPLDDSWIHQTFARNLIHRGEFAYNSGVPSTASTSPLWTLMLTTGYLLPGDFRLWAYGIGLLFLGITAWVGYLLCRHLFPQRPRLAIAAAVAILLEWRLNWAALSGMETVLFALSCLALIYLACLALSRELSPARIALLGATAGLATVVRPEGVILSALALAVIVWRQKAKAWVAVALGIWLIFVLPLVAFNVVVGSSPMPSTFYAKSAAYAMPLTLSFAATYLSSAIATIAGGPLVVLLPGVAYVAYRIGREAMRGERRSRRGAVFFGESSLARPHPSPLPQGEGTEITSFSEGEERPTTPFPLAKGDGRPALPSPFARGEGPLSYSLVTGGSGTAVGGFVLIGLWVIILLGLYMVRLPALFHHGRYIMPLIPPLLVVGIGGIAALGEVVAFRLLTKVYGGLIALVFLVLWVNGAVVYGWDVKFIDDEEVATAVWLGENVPSEAVIATHDIGAIGYFSGRDVIDTAGLITPELGPYVRDEAKILSYIQDRKVDYLAVFPKWYPSIVKDPRLQEVFRIERDYAVLAGADNMVVYLSKW